MFLRQWAVKEACIGEEELDIGQEARDCLVLICHHFMLERYTYT
jgi:hypothetical protein